MRILTALGLAAALAAPARAADTTHWTATWYASPHATWGADFPLPTGVPAMLKEQTVRETARISIGGRRVRVVLSNRYGTQPVEIGAAHVAGHNAGAGHALTFGGKRHATIAAGAPLVSDPVDMRVAALDKLVVDVYLPLATPLESFHWGAQQTGRIVAGDRTGAPLLTGGQPLQGRALLSQILVDAESPVGVIVALGDSITDGNGSTPDRDRRWPDYLAARLQAQPGAKTGGQLEVQRMAVVNAGISGARLLGDRMGANAAARFEQDVLGQPGVTSVVVLLGINDIGWPQSAFAPHEAPMTASRMIAAYRQLIAQSHTRGVRIIGATLPPFEGALQGTPLDGYHTPAKDAVRREVNRWIKDGGEFDVVVDFDALLRDPARPARMLARYDSGDHLHPGDAGYEAMAAAVEELVSR